MTTLPILFYYLFSGSGFPESITSSSFAACLCLSLISSHTMSSARISVPPYHIILCSFSLGPHICAAYCFPFRSDVYSSIVAARCTLQYSTLVFLSMLQITFVYSEYISMTIVPSDLTHGLMYCTSFASPRSRNRQQGIQKL
ncbi:hypothetical protein BJX70DRAFT_374147 [Aspergillus crustosus]